MKISNHAAVPVYTVSGSNTARPLPEWLARKRKRSLKTDPEYASRVELLQDFEFEEASQCIRASEDGEWLMSTGTYKPQIHTHFLPHLSCSFSRHTPALNYKFELLSSDYSKSLHLQTDRSLEFHTPSGCHYATRIPRYGRDLKLHRHAAEALIPATGIGDHGQGEVFRLNLELGQFMRPFEVDVHDEATVVPESAIQGCVDVGAVNVAAIAAESHNLLAFGTSLGTIEFRDPRTRARVAILRNSAAGSEIGESPEVTALQFDGAGLGLACGSASGIVNLYDLRNPVPLLKKDQGYGYPIQDIIYLESPLQAEPKILTSDKRIIKIWDARSGKAWTSVEPAVDLHGVVWCKDSGMLLTANEGRQQHSFFIPQLGPAPRWCSFLDNLVEEMAEDPDDPQAFANQQIGQVYDNFKFLTHEQLETLNLSHLIGTTSLLRPYMHGFFVAQRLYEEAKLIANPFVWEEQRNKLVQDKIDAERESRIRGNKKVEAKVNKKLAAKITEQQERRNQARPNLLSDSRFSQLFADEDFAIDERSREFQLLNPSTKPTDPISSPKLTAVEQEELDDPVSDSSASSEPKSLSRRADRISTSSYRKNGHKDIPLRVSSSTQPARNDDRSFRSRTAVAAKFTGSNLSAAVGGKEVTFAPAPRSRKQDKPRPMAQPRQEGRRSASGNVFRRM